MIETVLTTFGDALATQGLWALAIAVFLAGIVRGFTGFGTAMVYLPIAGTILPPVWAILSLMVFDLLGPLPNIPRALRDGAPRDIGRLVGGTLIGLPLGLFLLFRLEPDIFRWIVSVVTLTLLALLVLGWRYRGELSWRMMLSTGGLSGFLGGVSGLPGPPVIMLYMSSSQAVASIRANILLYLLVFDLLALTLMAVAGRMELLPMMIGGVLIIPYLVGNIAGAALFRPRFEKFYRRVAYVLIAVSALFHLPVWG